LNDLRPKDYPFTTLNYSKGNDGYYMIASNITLFQAINQLSITLDPIRLDEDDGIEETLRRNNAKYHQNCSPCDTELLEQE
jgi:hypothetical protein